MKFKRILLFSGTKGILYRTSLLRTVERIFKVPYLHQENTFLLVYSSCLFLPGSKTDKVQNCKSFATPDMIWDRSGNWWSVSQNKPEGWLAWVVCRKNLHWTAEYRLKTQCRAYIVIHLGWIFVLNILPIFPSNWPYNCFIYSVNPHRTFLDFWYIFYILKQMENVFFLESI